MRQTVANIIQETAEKYRLRPTDITGPNTGRRYTLPRQEAYFRAFTETPHLSYPEIGRRMGGKHHTSVLAGVRKHCQRNDLSYDVFALARAARGAHTGKRLFCIAHLAPKYAQTMEAAYAG